MLLSAKGKKVRRNSLKCKNIEKNWNKVIYTNYIDINIAVVGGRVQTISKPQILFRHNSNKGRNGSKEIRGMSPVELSNFLMDWQFYTHQAL